MGTLVMFDARMMVGFLPASRYGRRMRSFSADARGVVVKTLGGDDENNNVNCARFPRPTPISPSFLDIPKQPFRKASLCCAATHGNSYLTRYVTVVSPSLGTVIGKITVRLSTFSKSWLFSKMFQSEQR